VEEFPHHVELEYVVKEVWECYKTTSNPPTIDDEGISSHSSYSDGEVALYIRDMETTLNITKATTTEEWGHWEGILEERNKRNNNTSDKEVVLNILRDLEATLNANPTKEITTTERS